MSGSDVPTTALQTFSKRPHRSSSTRHCGRYSGCPFRRALGNAGRRAPHPDHEPHPEPGHRDVGTPGAELAHIAPGRLQRHHQVPGQLSASWNTSGVPGLARCALPRVPTSDGTPGVVIVTDELFTQRQHAHAGGLVIPLDAEDWPSRRPHRVTDHRLHRRHLSRGRRSQEHGGDVQLRRRGEP